MHEWVYGRPRCGITSPGTGSLCEGTCGAGETQAPSILQTKAVIINCLPSVNGPTFPAGKGGKGPSARPET